MNYAGLIKNDLAAAPGVCTTLFVQGCHLHCFNCHNQDSWDFGGGAPFTKEVMKTILSSLSANGIKRTFCIMGGEPLAMENIETVLKIAYTVKKEYPEIKIWVWTGFRLEDLLEHNDVLPLNELLSIIDVLVDGPYIERLRDITLPHRGSSNQNIWSKNENNIWEKGIVT